MLSDLIIVTLVFAKVLPACQLSIIDIKSRFSYALAIGHATVAFRRTFLKKQDFMSRDITIGLKTRGYGRQHLGIIVK